MQTWDREQNKSGAPQGSGLRETRHMEEMSREPRETKRDRKASGRMPKRD